MDPYPSDIIISRILVQEFGGNEFDIVEPDDIFNSLFVYDYDSATAPPIEYSTGDHSPKRKYLENDEQRTKRQKLVESMEKMFTFPSLDIDDHSSSDLAGILNSFSFFNGNENLSTSCATLFNSNKSEENFIDQLWKEENTLDMECLKNIRMSIETRESKSKPFVTSNVNLDQLGKFKKIVIDFADSLPSLLTHFQQLSITLRRKTLKDMGRYNGNIGEAEIFFCLNPDCCSRIKYDNKKENINYSTQLAPSKYQCKNKERWQEKEFSLEEILKSHQSSFSFCLKPEWKGVGFKSNWIKPVYVFEIALANHNIGTKRVLYSFDIELQPHKFESKQKKKEQLSNSL